MATRIYISADMEGVAGVVSPTQCQVEPPGREYTRYCHFMTQEVNAAIQGAIDAGATEIVVSDSHGFGENILIEELPSHVTLVRGLTRPLMMMQGIELGKFDGVIFIGYHSSANYEGGGVLQHTIHSRLFAEVILNGISASESMLNASIATEFGAPIIMISGDDALQKELQKHDMFKNVHYAVTKHSIGYMSAASLTPEASCKLIRETAKEAVTKRNTAKIAEFPPNPELVIKFKRQLHAELLGLLPCVERIDAYSIRYKAKNYTEITSFLRFVTKYNCTDT